ncbi:MAG: amidohydrolase, partial [Firmicutes bacterium]|nr:amidohydrolase [Bacillota bacterium]
KLLLRQSADPSEAPVYEVMDGYLGVEGKTIDYIGPDRPAKRYNEEKDMGGSLLMPGLANAHGHAAMTLVRGVGSDLNLQDWLFGKIVPIEDRMTAEDVVAGTEYAILEMLACGTTVYADMYSFPVECAEAAAKAGIKANIPRPLICFDPEMEADDCDRIRETPAMFRAIDGMGDGRVLADFCMHSEYLTTEKTVRRYAEMCKEFGARMQVHLSETKKEHDECIARHGLTPMAYFEKLGVLDSPVYAAHCVWVTDEDLDIAARHGLIIAHNPTSNLKLGSGFAPIPEAMAKGIRIALGTDGCASNNNLNLWEEMHLTAILHKGHTGDPTMVTPAQVLDMATLNGCIAMGRKNSGVLAAGKDADIICVDLNALHMQPALDIPALLVYSAQGSDVKMTMVDGRILYENGEYYTLDKDRVIADFKKSCKRLLNI